MCTKNENIKKHIEELEVIVKHLHRSAINLDILIEHLKFELEYSDEWFFDGDVETIVENRKTFKNNRGYNDINEMEEDIWARLLTDVKREES